MEAADALQTSLAITYSEMAGWSDWICKFTVGPSELGLTAEAAPNRFLSCVVELRWNEVHPYRHRTELLGQPKTAPATTATCVEYPIAAPDFGELG